MPDFLKGSSFYYPLKQRAQTPHLWIVITDPRPEDGKCVAVNLTSYKNNQGDTNCEVAVGEHPFVKHLSVVIYGNAMLVEPGVLEDLEYNGLLEERERVSPELLARIQEGALRSDDMNPRFADLVRKYG
jgi:hypothetical protein